MLAEATVSVWGFRHWKLNLPAGGEFAAVYLREFSGGNEYRAGAAIRVQMSAASSMMTRDEALQLARALIVYSETGRLPAPSEG